jgi:MerR family transcriptional regulator, light-induced transcriptional regulator
MTMPDESRYNIGAVSRLSGVSREKIRIWERRYGAVQPGRDPTNHRLYSRHDIERLSLIRKLVDAGHAVSGVASLPLEELEARLRTPGGAAAADGPQRVLIITAEGAALRDLLEDLGVTDLTQAENPVAAEAWLQNHRPDLVVAELPTLLSRDLPVLIRLRRLAPHSRLLIVYRFAATALLAQAEMLGIAAVKAPLQPGDLQRPGPYATTSARAPDHRERRFTSEQLRQAASLASNLKCECPSHLADLVRDLCAFEDYSLSCEAETPRDAALHREIYDIAARARALLEDALGIVASEEAIPL